MASYQKFALRPTPPDPVALLASLRALDATAGLAVAEDGITVKKATAWTAPQITAAQNAITAAPDITPQRQAQNEIDAWPIAPKAFALALIDQLNVLRGDITTLGINRQAITTPAALAAIRAKAGTL